MTKSVVMKDLEEESVKKWQGKWTQTTTGRTTKEYFPYVSERLKMKLQLTQKIIVIVSGHGKTRDYLHIFKIRKVVGLHDSKDSDLCRHPFWHMGVNISRKVMC